MSLQKQVAAIANITFVQRVGAAIVRHATWVKSTEGSRSNAEIAWANATLGYQYATMHDRSVRYVAGQPSVYNALDASEVSVTDTMILNIVPDLPTRLPPTL